MTATDPSPELDGRYGSPDAPAVSWADARERAASAELYWLATVRANGQPHVTPLLALWHGGVAHVTTGPLEQKARNLAVNPRCTLLTGTNAFGTDAFDVVVEGSAERVTDPGMLQQLADGWAAKYGEEWRFGVGDAAFVHGDADEHVAHVFAIRPGTAYGFAKGDVPAHIRYRF